MKFANAYKGLKTLKMAEVLNIIGLSAAALIILVSIVVMGGIGSRADLSTQDVANAMGGSLILLVGGFVSVALAVIAYILQIIGINEAKTDDEGFDNALMFVIGGIVVSLISGGASGWFGVVMSIASKVLSVIVTLCIISGIRSTAKRLGNTEVENKGRTVNIIVIVLAVIAIALSVAGSFIPSFEMLLVFVTGCFNVAKSAVFLAYLSSAVKMFGIEEMKAV